MKYVYILEHTYQLEDDFGTHEEFKYIGVYSSQKNAENAMSRLKDQEGFKDYPVECFSINKAVLNQDSWVDGFFTYHYSD